MTVNKSFQVQENELRSSCNKISGNLFTAIREFHQSLSVIEMASPTIFEEMIYKDLGRPAWGGINDNPGWSPFYHYIKLMEERYSVFPFTLFEPKKKNPYFIRNIQALREEGGADKIKASKLESMDSLQIIMMFENETEMAVPIKRALNMCFPTELVGLSATSTEADKALQAELNRDSKTKKILDLPPAKNAGNPASIDQLYEIMTSEMPL